MPPSPESLRALRAFGRLAGRPVIELADIPHSIGCAIHRDKSGNYTIQRHSPFIIHIAFVDLGDGTILSAAANKPKVVCMRNRLRDVLKDVELKYRWKTIVAT